MGVKLFRLSLIVCGIVIGAGFNETQAQPIAAGIAIIFVLLALYGVFIPKSEDPVLSAFMNRNGKTNTFKDEDKKKEE